MATRKTKASWIHLQIPPQPAVTGTLTVANIILLFCGAVACIMCFYGLSQVGSRYYLIFSLMAGIIFLLIGSLGFRSQYWQQVPNRNYVSGHIILSFFSILACVGLIILASVPSGHYTGPIVDLVGGAECGIAILSLLLALIGVLSSYCCKYPPPDNRVTHCAEGITL